MVRDLFFRVRLEAGLRALGVPFRVVGAGDVLAAVQDARPDVVILDLSDPGLRPLAVLTELRSRSELPPVRVLGYAAHVDRELRRAALQAGCDAVVTRARISSALADVLRPLLPRAREEPSGPATGA